jgi:tetratricopeptide (TPR) repeat protein
MLRTNAFVRYEKSTTANCINNKKHSQWWARETLWRLRFLEMKRLTISLDYLFGFGGVLFFLHLFASEYLDIHLPGYAPIRCTLMALIVFLVIKQKPNIDKWMSVLYMLLLFRFFFGDLLKELTPWYLIVVYPISAFVLTVVIVRQMKTLGQPSKAISYFTFRRDAINRVTRLWQLKEYDQVISLTSSMLTKNPTDALAFYYRALSYEMLKLFELAVEDLAQAELNLSRSSQQGLLQEYFVKIPIQLSRVHRKLQNKEIALEYADTAVTADKHGIDGLLWRASLKEDFGDLVGASEDLNTALTRQPTNEGLKKSRDRLTYLIIEHKKYQANR